MMALEPVKTMSVVSELSFRKLCSSRVLMSVRQWVWWRCTVVCHQRNSENLDHVD